MKIKVGSDTLSPSHIKYKGKYICFDIQISYTVRILRHLHNSTCTSSFSVIILLEGDYFIPEKAKGVDRTLIHSAHAQLV